MIPTLTKYEFPTPLQLEDIGKSEKGFFPGKKTFFVNRLILIFKQADVEHEKNRRTALNVKIQCLETSRNSIT